MAPLHLPVNDYFDHALDSASPACAHKPLPSGAFSIDFPLLLACTIYTVLLSLVCLIPVPAVRVAIAASVLTTLAYTPLLKRVVLLKNASVAATVAAAPLAGALAAGAGASWGGLGRVLPASLFMGAMICSR